MLQNELTNDHDLDLDFTPLPGGNYVPVNVRSNIAYVAIQFPIAREGNRFLGRMGKELTTLDGYNAARQAAINILAQMKKFVGLKNIQGLNHIEIYYRCVQDWDEGPRVADGASDLFVNVLGPKGTHSRSLLGVDSLPRSFSVGVTASFTILKQPPTSI